VRTDSSVSQTPAHNAALINQGILKTDVWELLNLVRLLDVFVQRPVSGMAEEKAGIEFETRLQAALQKHGIER